MTAPALSPSAQDTIRRALLAMPQEQFNSFIDGVKASRLAKATAAGPLPINTRIRMNSTVRPLRIAGRTAVIVSVSRGRKGWSYRVRFDGSNETYVRITADTFVVHNGDPINADSRY